MRPISLGGPFLLCVDVMTTSTKLSAEIFAVRHSPYAVSKFELFRPSEHEENGWEHFMRQQEYYENEKRQRKF